ncbi:isopentenyl-diphosphate Delta-isomerase [Candidatus Woesearchaeota archaeon]|nr:isopentenyl-diphosphate Delta-isomerase [Candidatus Woesearchaeota archaeon]
MHTETLILVDEHDQVIGYGEKMAVHREGRLHRAFSLFVINEKKELMLQQRALGKYHSGGLWTNTCCSHPRPDETISLAAHRRLPEEMGFDCDLHELCSFTYEVKFPNGLQEHEFLHVLVGHYNGKPVLNNEEAEDWKWASFSWLQKDIVLHPEHYTAWFLIAFPRVVQALRSR